MKIHESAEDYLERILILKKEKGKVISIDIANSMNYSKPSISRAMKNLRENDYITFEENGEINLTEKGLNIAQKIYERHVLLTNYFMALGVKEETARNDACKVEHDLSEETFNAIKAHVEKTNKKNK
ncbi:MAG: metal-dependent transcriptional regulator [Coprobacillus sp.]|nr:metal-dependent transcriptional regulator [Coprobacillus sp.]MDY4145295.1 metal-dependent transcriptional regulator [Bacilli bacterium]